MPVRASSLQSYTVTGIERVTDSQYDTIAAIAENIDTLLQLGNEVTITSVTTVSDNIDLLTSVESQLDEINNFRDVYIGASTVAPSVRYDGSALAIGDLYFDSTSSIMYAWDGSTWVAAYATLAGVAMLDSDVAFNSVQFNGGGTDEGTLSWNADEKTLDLTAGNTILQLGQELVSPCRNNTGSTIANGTVVMKAGTLGASGVILIKPYDNVSSEHMIIGVATEDIADGTNGKVTDFGKVRGIDTSSFSENDVLYVGTDGVLTNVKPTAGICIPIAVVISSANNGTIMVRFTPIDENTTKNNVANTFTYPQRGKTAFTAGTSINLALGNNIMTGPITDSTLNFVNLVDGQSGNIIFVNLSGYVISASSTVIINSEDLNTISVAGTYWMSYFTDGANVFVSVSKVLTAGGA